MTDPWSGDPLYWPGMKLIRALQHLKTIKDEIDAGEEYRIVPDFQSEPGYLVIKVRGEPSPFWSLAVGEVLYHCRSALDHLACVLTEENGNVVDNFVEFPIFLRREDFRDDAGNLTRQIERRIGGTPSEKQAIIEEEQPFQGKYGAPENDPLAWLYTLSNYDRHKFLHLVSLVTFDGREEFTPQWFAERFFTEVSRNYGAFEGETEVARFSIAPAAFEVDPPVAVQVKSHVTFGIAFDEKGPGVGRPALSTLGTIGERVGKIIQRLR